MRVLIAGCGYVGTELGLRLTRKGGHEVWGLRRDPSRLPACIWPVCADLLTPSLHSRLPNVDGVVYAASADASSPEGYRDAYATGVENLLRALESLSTPPSRLIFISSIAVYGEAAGEWVDEDTVPSPADFRGAEILKGEDFVRNGSIPGVSFRLGGIYGPARARLLERVRSGEASCLGNEHVWSNRIHRNDAAGALMHLLTRDDPEPVYIGVDDEPSPICEVYRYLARLAGVPEPAVGAKSREQSSNKRCSNRLLRSSGYSFEFPTFREGYRALVESETGRAG